MKKRDPVRDFSWARLAGFARVFDIVNGFLIDAVAHRVWFKDQARMRHIQMQIWLRLIVRTYCCRLVAWGEEGCRFMQAASGLASRPVVDGVDSQA